MVTYSETLDVPRTREGQTVDLTDAVEEAVARSKVRDGIACIFTPSSTSAIIANEYEPGLMGEDIPGALQRLFPRDIPYGHEKRWHDGNGHSHVRATFLGPSLAVPVRDGRLALGTWQQVTFVELDNKPRDRRVIVQLVGE